MRHSGSLLILSFFASFHYVAHAQRSLYQPCPILGPFVPAPSIDSRSPVVESVAHDLNELLDDYVGKADGRFGPITPNTTSFSLALFAGAKYVAGTDDLPFFYEYHHTASILQGGDMDKDSQFALGDLTQLFTVYTQLIELGDEAWSHSIVDYVPELRIVSANASDAISQVQWEDVTLGALAGHMSGIARDSNACTIEGPCNKEEFVSALRSKPPVNLPDTTPIRSDAAFQLLALAVESATKRPFDQSFRNRIRTPLDLGNTHFLKPRMQLFGNGLSNTSMVGEQAALGLVSTISDLAKLGRAILTSELLPSATTRRWLKPFTSTSNLRNAVGRAWEIYHYSTLPTDPVIDVYMKTGSVGRYSSHFGLVPSHDIGFAILAVDCEREALDLNAYADITLGALLQVDKLARAQANATLVGTYTADNNSTLAIGPATADPGLTVVELRVNGTDWLAQIAWRADIEPTNDIDFRLYPTSLEKGNRRAFRAVIQDMDALADAGTPTCISWQQTVDVFERGGLPLDQFVFVTDDRGIVVMVEAEALGVVFKRT